MSLAVGPVILRGEVGDAIIAALQSDNPQAVLKAHAAYVRVAAPDMCRLSRETVEERLGRALLLPRELESVMPSFSGRIVFRADSVVWHAAVAP